MRIDPDFKLYTPRHDIEGIALAGSAGFFSEFLIDDLSCGMRVSALL